MIGAFYMIYIKVFKNDTLSFNALKNEVLESALFHTKNLAFVIALTALNWLLECKKWQILVNSFKSISFNEAAKQSLSSLTTSLITPNRIGEYGAKAFFYDKKDTKRILFLNFIGNSSQLIITCIFGSLGFLFLWQTLDFKIEGFTNTYIILITGILLGFFGLGFILLKQFKNHVVFKTDYILIAKSLGLAFMRYAVFSFQFYLLLRLFSIEIETITAYLCITSMYLLASIIPTISLFDVVLKSSIAVLPFGFVGVETLPVLVIVLIMWLLNFALPALIGSYFVLTYKSKIQLK